MTGPVYCAKYAIAAMQKNGDEGGVVIGCASLCAVMPLMFGALLPIYHPTKAYMDGLTRSIAATHAPFNIKAFNVNPMATMTDMWEKLYDNIPDYGKPMLDEMGVKNSTDYAVGFNKSVCTDEKKDMPLIYPEDISRVALAFADGSTKYESGDAVITTAGCTYHVQEFYPAIYGPNPRLGAPGVGWNLDPANLTNPTIGGRAAMRDSAGNFLYPDAEQDGD